MAKLDKRDEIVRAALELIAEHGFHGAPMAMIAGRAGVGAGTIYRYFENKDVMITELFRELEERSYPLIKEGYAPDKPHRERFIHLNTALMHYFIGNPLDYRFIEQFFNSPYGVAHRRDKLFGTKEGCDVFKELFEEGISQQVMKDLPIVILFDLAFGPILGVARDHILGFIVLDDALIARTVEACWDAIKR
ncbi:MAG: TetR/AcrR family transcriptional regulator [Geobacteraceae bacterium]|nr:TetR/AcrR family transcriptional regulator [Geobacteraceae bacterium]NTW81018.1 TetR/AcrR family transcriptional regulator [Geobacteraceae bacterium]